MPDKAWVSFCISTYKRPEILRKQLELLSKQTFPLFEVVISDNDPGASAREVVNQMNDERFRYWHNGENLGMIKSFNKSIERAGTDFIVMVTDDDPVQPDFLEKFYKLHLEYPDYSIYCGFLRKGKSESQVEIILSNEFLTEVLDPGKTTNILWSSSVIRREDAVSIGLIPDYGSPHLADHAFLALVGTVKGGIVINKMYSSLFSHDTNYSKSNLINYVNGCKGFYHWTLDRFSTNPEFVTYKKTALKHLENWFLANFFGLRKYYVKNGEQKEKISELDSCAKEIMSLEYMRGVRVKYSLKKILFRIKRIFRLLK
ncbi:MAG TPA: glycosyltransferase family 2 protein [Chitinophagaceae bacterium]|nr:glycosyltransferase family 2 protein [Chitinophagaceae bacterium]